ncbi:MAG: DNA polymerase Y family protein [Gammaproteobacteria bacterium]|nr:DNA polymerase Y family protein [Gammaproteobacteria bacterium]
MKLDEIAAPLQIPPLGRTAPMTLASVTTTAPEPEAANRLWLAVHLPRFTLDMATRGNAERKACVLVDGEGARQRISLANAEAVRLGIRVGMPLAAAHALGEVLAFMRVPAAEERAMEQLCDWAYQFTPLVAPVAPNGLLMEIRGSLGLFGGLSGLVARLRRELRQLGFQTIAFGTAPTPTAAIWLARARQSAAVESLATLPAALSQVSLEVLDLPAKLQQDFCGIGVRTIGECLRLPRDSLARRFTPDLLLSLDRALGRAPDPRAAFVPRQRFASRIDLLWEIHHAQGLALAMERLLNELTGVLRAQASVSRHLLWQLHHADGSVTQHPIGLLEPSREALHLLRVSREYFLRQQLHAPVRGISLEVAQFEVLPSAPGRDLFARREDTAERETLPRFAERLRARLGERALQTLRTQADHRPEWASRLQAVNTSSLNAPAPQAQDLSRRWPERPLWLTRQPLPLMEHDGRPSYDGPLELANERERIEAGWWDGAQVSRDYFIARNQHGSRLWVFRDLAGSRGWFLHGIFE